MATALIAKNENRQPRIDDAWRFLRPYFDDLNPDQDILIRSGRPAVVMAEDSCTPMALQRAASARPGVITVHPSLFDLTTASGLSLLAHELEHQRQFQQDPRSLHDYAREQRRIEQQNLPPWENKYERPAYEVEADVYEQAMAAGYPPGKHRPLLLSEAAAEGDFGQLSDYQKVLLGFTTASFLVGMGRLIMRAGR